MLLKFLFSSIILLPTCFAFLTKRYDNYSLFSAVPITEKQLDFFRNLEDTNSLGVNFWIRPGSVNHSVSLIVPPENQTVFLNQTDMLGIKVTTLLKNVQWALDEQKGKSYTRRNMDSFDWYNYYGIESIYSWLQDLVNRYNGRIKLINIGKSFEGRDILGIHIPSEGKHDVFIEGGMHAREWISPAFVTFLIHQLVTAKERNDQDLMMAVKNYGWHLFPVVNPDGYAFTHYQDRLWRKNRRKFLNGQFGVDLNRNFDYNFNTVGVSNDNSKETYCGTSAFSEPETKALSDYVDTIGHKLKFYMSFHSYGQYFIIPYADSRFHRDNFQDVADMGRRCLAQLRSHYNTPYKIGTAHDTIDYMVSGSSVDWAKKKYNIPVAVNIELRDDGPHGFALPLNEILPTCKETLACVLELVNWRPQQLSAKGIPPLSSLYNPPVGVTSVSSEIESFAERRACVAITVVILNIFLY